METYAQAEVDAVDRTVRGIFANVLQIDPAGLEAGTGLVSDLAVDSLDALELALKIQESLDIQIGDEQFARFTTYGEIVDCAREVLSRKSAEH